MPRLREFDFGLIALGAALNVTIGYLAGMLKIPLYLDSIGTVLVAALCGWMSGLFAGLAALVVLSATSTPTVIAYAGTAVAVAFISAGAARLGFLVKPVPTVLWGLVIGLVCAATSAPVTTFVFGGVSLAGADAITTLFKASGMPLWESVLFGSLVTDPADKIVTSLVCLALARSLPPRMRDRLPGAGAAVRR